jgi:hypothetical protein
LVSGNDGVGVQLNSAVSVQDKKAAYIVIEVRVFLIKKSSSSLAQSILIFEYY